MSKESGDYGTEGMELDIKSSVDLDILGDNIADIAPFTVEKYEFSQGETLPAAVREEAVKQI